MFDKNQYLLTNIENFKCAFKGILIHTYILYHNVDTYELFSDKQLYRYNSCNISKIFEHKIRKHNNSSNSVEGIFILTEILK